MLQLRYFVSTAQTGSATRAVLDAATDFSAGPEAPTRLNPGYFATLGPLWVPRAVAGLWDDFQGISLGLVEVDLAMTYDIELMCGACLSCAKTTASRGSITAVSGPKTRSSIRASPDTTKTTSVVPVGTISAGPVCTDTLAPV